MVKYNPGTDDVAISLERNGKEVRISFVDVEKQPFDITRKEDINAHLPIEQRRPGGLGIYLTKKLMDRVEYTHDGVHSRITLTKHLE